MTDHTPNPNTPSIEVASTRSATPMLVGAAVAILPALTLVAVLSLTGGMTTALWLVVGFLLLGGMTAAAVLVMLGRRQPSRWRLDTKGITTVARSGAEDRVNWRQVERVTLVDRIESAGRHSVRRRRLEFAVEGRPPVAIERMTRDPDGDLAALGALARDCYARGWLTDAAPYTEDTPATRGL
jgi:hypothetical protein